MPSEHTPQVTGPELLDAPPPSAGGVCIGTLVSAEPGAGLRVVYPGHGWDPVAARSTVAVTPSAVGQQVVLAFEQSDPQRPVVLGVLQTAPVHEPPPQAPVPQEHAAVLPAGANRQVRVDGRTVCIEAERELVLQCGKSSILLRASGEVVVKGLKIVSRARRTNKIKGGNVLIN
ncbi:MAG: DUF6484 domain-containing protein [Bacteroidota bacterium]